MSEQRQRHDMTLMRVIYEIPGMQRLPVDREIVYQGTALGPLSLDVYRPEQKLAGDKRPAVILVTGYPDPGFEAMVGCKLKDMQGYVSWGELLAASGLIAVTYTNHDPVADLEALLRYLRANAERLGLDEQKLGIWACSGNVPNALSRLMRSASVRFRAAALCYGPMLDLGGSTTIADAAASLGFAYPCAGKTVEDMVSETPIMIVRAGRDEMPGLNDSIDRFVTAALARNLPVSVINQPSAPHAFDLVDDTEDSREAVRRILAFLRHHLLV